MSNVGCLCEFSYYTIMFLVMKKDKKDKKDKDKYNLPNSAADKWLVNGYMTQMLVMFNNMFEHLCAEIKDIYAWLDG